MAIGRSTQVKLDLQPSVVGPDTSRTLDERFCLPPAVPYIERGPHAPHRYHRGEPLSADSPTSAHRFQDCDAIAMRLGVEKTAMIRLRAGVSFALAEAMDEGHCGLPMDELIPRRSRAFLSSTTSINCGRSAPGAAWRTSSGRTRYGWCGPPRSFGRRPLAASSSTHHRINLGLMPELATPVGDSDFYFVPADDPETAAARLSSWRRPASQSASTSIQFANSRSCVR